MSGQAFGQDDGFFQTGYSHNENQGFDMAGGGYPPQQQSDFGAFDYSQGAQSNQPPAYDQSMYAGNIMTPEAVAAPYSAGTDDDYDNELPLMEELGINFDHMLQKTLTVLNPFLSADASIMQDTDLAGPLVFCLAFGATLLLAGKVHFGYIYGIGLLGCVCMYYLLNLMSMTGVSVGITVSVLGYCLLPMVLLSALAIVLSLKGLAGTVLTAIAVAWCSYSASKLFVSALAMDHQQPLVAYPCALVYGVFALLTVF